MASSGSFLDSLEDSGASAGTASGSAAGEASGSDSVDGDSVAFVSVSAATVGLVSNVSI